MTQQQIDKLVELHNTIRSSVSPTADEMLRLSWNYDLEASAASKAKSCAFRWSPTNSRLDNAGHGSGENVWVGWGVNFTTLDVNSPITTWFAEQKYFDPELQQCLGGSCEHYVQIIWHDVYRIGCAWNECNDIKVYGYPVNTAVFLVCHYGPRGARQPLFPYFRGVACSFCGQEDRCEYSLCTNDEREKTAENVTSDYKKKKRHIYDSICLIYKLAPLIKLCLVAITVKHIRSNIPLIK
uniref:SCP domain-containing protein n=1 Tax=Ciona intestinalis TaxID=7719 RepID=F6QK47_CIOIN